MENKKKLTISGNPKKPIKNLDFSKTRGKKTVIIEKHSSKQGYKGSFNKSSGFKSNSSSFKKNFSDKQNFINKVPSSATSDFERRKLAEQRATKRLKGELENKEKNQN